MKIAVINGSPRKIGRTGIAARYLAKKYEAELIDLSDGSIPMYTGESSQYELESVKHLINTIAEADGVVLTTPEYHSGMSGALKNALDFLSSEQFAHKPVALLAVAGGGKGGINALNSMRIAARGLYANVIPKQLVLDPPCFDRDNDTLNDDSAELVDGLMSELQLYMPFYRQIKK